MKQMKLSELTYEYLKSVGLCRAHMHTDRTDELRVISGKMTFEIAKKCLYQKYGNVELSIDPAAPWYARIVILDERWKQDHDMYMSKKANWISRNGCD